MKRLVIFLLIAGCGGPRTTENSPTKNVSENEEELVKKLQSKAVHSVNESVNKTTAGELFSKGTRLLNGKIEVQEVKTQGGKRIVTLRNLTDDKVEFQVRFIYFNKSWKREIITDNSRVYKELSILPNQTAVLESVDMNLVDADEVRLDIKSK
jgi:uncharacterized protein YcfL